ncbi:type-X family DNA polymerase [Patescibacteria group bacterium]|nr:type-X family DNA polymerase [Patescibacteria group bacterium]MBU1683373.1 type-X family DNA polymerase [Patescibacteria group bacterium]MBU1934431.1 type-X family DNA polymerase [Patescibacteria group bacterium]
MTPLNKKIYQLFNEIADLMGIMGEGFFRIRAYREAGRVLMEEADPITNKTTKKQLLQINRIGDALADKILEYIKTGHIHFLEDLRLQVPKSVRDMLKIPGLGAGRVGKLYFLAGIKSKKDLIKAAKNDELVSIPGFGPKIIANILQAIKTDQQKKKRHIKKDLEPIAKKLVTILKKIKGVSQVEICGSYRRGALAVGDLDILVVDTKKAAQEAEKPIRKSFPDLTILASGETKISFVIFPNKLQIDIRFVPEESYGAALLYFTGSKEYNVMMRKVAIEKGYLLNEYGLFKDGEYIAGKTEKEVFEKLGLKYKEPKNRK